MILQTLFPFLLIASGQPVTLTPDTFDLTGRHSIVVSDTIRGVPGTVIRYSQGEDSDSAFVFNAVTGAVFIGIEFQGPGENTQGYIGAIRTRSTSVITDCIFTGWNKWALDFRGIRWTLTDTSFVTNCKISNSKSAGYGYGLWNQYGTVVISNVHFKDNRHHVDGGSEGHRTILRNCRFERASQSAVHNHKYTGGYSGSGTDVIGCYFAANALDIDLEPAFPPYQNTIADTTRWNGISTGFWIKSLGVALTVTGGGDTVTITSNEWKYHLLRYAARIHLSGSGTVFIDDFIQGSRIFLMEDGKIPRIKYLTPAKVDRSVEDQISGDKSMRVRLEAGRVEVY